MHLLCVRSAAQHSSRLYARMCSWDCAHRLPPDWAHSGPPRTGTKSTPHPHLQLDRVDPLPTSALRKSPSPAAHLCADNRINPPPTSVPPLLPSGTSASARHKRGAAAQQTVLQPRALCCNRVPPVHDPAADGTCRNRLHAAALPCRWLHPIQSKPRHRRPNRVACAWHCGRRGLAPT